jgi:hypothetical protein
MRFAVAFVWMLAAAVVAGVEFADRIEVNPGGYPLVLNGAGVRTRLVFDVYAVALYLPAPRSDAEEAIASLGAKRIAIAMLRDVDADDFALALGTGLRRNHSEAQLQVFAPQIARLTEIMTGIGVAKRGTRVTLDLVPGGGTAVAVDGAPQGELIPGEDFYRALLRNWLGAQPVSDALKRALLSRRPAG